MNYDKKLVAIECDESGACVSALLVKNISDQEYLKLKNESFKSKAKEINTKKETLSRLEKLETNKKYFELLIAKSIYDNFVDRGQIENDEEFQKAWYDFIFNDKPLADNLNNDFDTILKKVGR